MVQCWRNQLSMNYEHGSNDVIDHFPSSNLVLNFIIIRLAHWQQTRSLPWYMLRLWFSVLRMRAPVLCAFICVLFSIEAEHGHIV